jgi:uncharacterized membrane protein YdfJ with MMPL/SSD domain
MDIPGIVATIALSLAVWLVLALVVAVTVGTTIRLRDSHRSIPPRSSAYETANSRSSYDSF